MKTGGALTERTKQQIIADWRTGTMTNAQVARKYDVSVQTVYNLTKEHDYDLMPMVDQAISDGADYELTAIERNAVKNAGKREISLTVLMEDMTAANLQIMQSKLADPKYYATMRMSDHKAVQATLADVKQTLGYGTLRDIAQSMELETDGKSPVQISFVSVESKDIIDEAITKIGDKVDSE